MIALCASVFAGFQTWKRGTIYQEKYWSPNGLFYVQKYRNWSIMSCVPAMPGSGSDSISGYIRLYDASHHLLDETYISFSRDVRPIWNKREVYLMGHDDDPPWILPRSSE